MAGYGRQGIVSDRVDQRYNRKSHHEAHDQGVALHVSAQQHAARIQVQRIEQQAHGCRARDRQQHGGEELDQFDDRALSPSRAAHELRNQGLTRARLAAQRSTMPTREAKARPNPRRRCRPDRRAIIAGRRRTGAFDRGTDPGRGKYANRQRGANKRKSPSRQHKRDAGRQELPQIGCEQERKGHDRDADQDRRKNPLDIRSDHQCRDEAQHDARQAGHHFDRRLDAGFRAQGARIRCCKSPTRAPAEPRITANK